MIQAQVYSAVRVTDKTLERHGQIGVLVGPGDVAGESAVKFEPTEPGGKQITETFEDASLELVSA